MDRILDALPGLLLLLSLGFVLWVIVLSWYTYHKLRTPPRRTVAWAISRGVASNPSELDNPLKFKELSPMSQHGWFKGLSFPLWDIAGLDPEGPVLIVTPGWGDSRVGALRRVEHLAKACSRIIAWDPPGLGEAPGKTTLGVHEPKLLRELIDTLDVPHNRIMLFGSSMGAGISIATGAQLDSPLRGIIAEAPYAEAHTPAYNVLREAGIPWRINGPIAFALLGVRMGIGRGWFGFNRARHASELGCPLLVLHGTADATCPIEDARIIAGAASRSSMEEIEGAGHNNLWSEEPYATLCGRACKSILKHPGFVMDTPGASIE